MRKLLLIAALSLHSLVYTQVWVVKPDWQENDSMIYFSSASFSEDGALIPVYNEIIPWGSESLAPKVELTVLSSSPLDEKYDPQIPKAFLKSSPNLSYQLVFERKKPFLQVAVTPFFINSETGKRERADEFEIKTGDGFQLASLKSQKKGLFTGTSLLSSGNWFKIGVKTNGIHKLSYEKLVEIGISNPANAKLYGAGAILLPEDYSAGSYDDLLQVPVYVSKGSDQIFGPGDYILFYAHGTSAWNYSGKEEFFTHELHPYSTMGYYFLTESAGSPAVPSTEELSNATAEQVVDSYDLLAFHEDEKYNLLRSGREWYGDNYEITLSGAYPFNLKGLLFSEPLKIKVTAAVRSNEESTILVRANSSSLGSLPFGTVNLSSYTSTYAIENSELFNYSSNREVNTIEVEYLKPNSNSEAWLNHIIINGRARLKMQGDELIFRDIRSVKYGTISEFRISSAGTNTVVWNISDPHQPKNVPLSFSGTTASFKLNTDVLKEFIAFNPGGSFPEPETTGSGLGLVANQNLHGTAPPDMLIIYSEEFEEQAERLANHRRENDKLSVLTVTQEMIFNEFSSGTPNISAIRNYLKMYYDNYPPDKMTSYLLLFGDGSFDNRDTVSGNPNKIMTYQSANSLVPTSSYVSDDFFGLLDTGEKLHDGMLDIGIGRLPVSTVAEAEMVVDKIIEYDQPETFGEWRNYICLIGDDEDGNIHMRQANSLAVSIEENYPEYNINKLFMDAYPQQTTPTGDLYPDVTRAINDQMNRGALIINYTGHGGVTGLAHEKILDLTNIKAWRNRGKYPLFMTATCEFSRYDEYDTSQKTEITSAGEEVLLNSNGGGIALFTTTRLVYSGPNHLLNEKFYEIVFEKKENGECYRLGDIIAFSKNNAGAGINKRNFTLLGDPATSLSFPKNIVVTDSVNSSPINEAALDTLSALDFVTIHGHLEDQKGTKLNTFNGTVIPIVYDKKSNLKTLANDGGSSMEFQLRNNILYKGNVSVKEGQFSFSFYVPKDISYNVGEGKISYYGFSEETDAHGSSNQLTIGGLGDFSGMDTVGPNIRLYMNDSLFKNGGIVNSTPELLVFVEDPFGINTTGNGIGHDITATLNEDRINAIILNEYYVADTDSYSSGSVRYPYDDLPLGKHTIEVRVWDIFNNSATKTIDFIVVESTQMLLENIFTYPNPFSDFTRFNIEHNRPDENLEVVIRIYNMQGNLVSILNTHPDSGGYRINSTTWEGKSMGGATLSEGLYVYKVVVRTESGEEAAGSGRVIIKR